MDLLENPVLIKFIIYFFVISIKLHYNGVYLTLYQIKLDI